jgi:hypothetical protein
MPKVGPRKLDDKTIPQLVASLDAVLSEYVRRNWIIDEAGTVRCYTCDTALHWKRSHCGHYIPRTESPTRHDERNLRPQCVGCNTFRSGMPHEYRRRLCDEIGADAVKELEADSRVKWKWDRESLMEQITYYREAVKEMS